MADRCSFVQVHFPGNRYYEVCSLFGLDDKGVKNKCFVDHGDGCLELYDVEAAGDYYLSDLREVNIPYYGFNTPGDNYSDMAFAFIGDEQEPLETCVVIASGGGWPVAEVLPNLQISPDCLNRIARYYAIENKVKEVMKQNKFQTTENILKNS